MINIKNARDIAGIKKSCDILKGMFDLMEKSVKPGVTTKQLDTLAYDYIVSHGGKPSQLGYCGFPATLCTSIDEVVVHGIPKDSDVIEEGQIVSIDSGVDLNGYFSDMARSYLVGDVSAQKKQLVKITEECFFKGVEGIKAGMRMGDIGGRIQEYAEGHGYGVVTALTGHGVGFDIHEDPAVPNTGRVGHGIRLLANITIAVEPMINLGRPEVDFLNDGWTVRTRDRKPSAHYENTVWIKEDGIEILTL